MGRHRTVLKYDVAEPYIQEGDVLLFKGTGVVSRLIQAYGGSPYSHCGLASWHNGQNNPPVLECVEQKEWIGGRTSLLKNYVGQFKGEIDVYRPNPYFITAYFNRKSKSVVQLKNKFNGKKVTSCMRNLTGLPYGYSRIWHIAKMKLIFLRLFVNFDSVTNDETINNQFQVCSTAIAHCFASNGYDLVKNRANEYTEPSDLARSPALDYLFTLSV